MDKQAEREGQSFRKEENACPGKSKGEDQNTENSVDGGNVVFVDQKSETVGEYKEQGVDDAPR